MTLVTLLTYNGGMSSETSIDTKQLIWCPGAEAAHTTNTNVRIKQQSITLKRTTATVVRICHRGVGTNAIVKFSLCCERHGVIKIG